MIYKQGIIYHIILYSRAVGLKGEAQNFGNILKKRQKTLSLIEMKNISSSILKSSGNVWDNILSAEKQWNSEINMKLDF